MKIIEPGFEILSPVNGEKILKSIERIGRVCYKSEDKISDGSAEKFVAGIIRRGHESVLEHEKITVLLICDRGVSHELVRHRIASYSQESTRYCNYSKDGFGKEITVIKPPFFGKPWGRKYHIWLLCCKQAEMTYFELLEMGATPQEARSVLPNSLKTEVVVTMNLREWRHFFKLRTEPVAHPQMREIAIPLLREFQRLVPVVFDDIGVESDE